MESSTYLKIFSCPEYPGSRLLYSTSRTALVRLPEERALAAMRGEPDPADEETLVRLGMLVPDRASEQREMAGVVDRLNAGNPRVGLTVIPGLACNLACVYCYEGSLKGKQAMTSETARRLVEFAASLLDGNKTRLEVVFHGGEPLLYAGMMEDLAGRLGAVCREREVSFRFTLVTNGTLLTRPLVEALLPLGLAGAKVTLDGPAGEHDRSRPFPNGSGSWEVIVSRLLEVADLLPVQVGGNFTRGNYRAFPRLLDELASRGLGPERLSLVKFDPVTRPADGMALPEFTGGCRSMDEPWLVEAGLFLREEILKRGFRTPRLRATPCIVEIESEYTVNWDGALYKCPAFIGRKELEVGSLETGVGDCRASHRIGAWKRPECRACAYLPLCFGGCRYLRLTSAGEIDGVDCRKIFLDAALEGLIRQEARYHLAGR